MKLTFSCIIMILLVKSFATIQYERDIKYDDRNCSKYRDESSCIRDCECTWCEPNGQETICYDPYDEIPQQCQDSNSTNIVCTQFSPGEIVFLILSVISVIMIIAFIIYAIYSWAKLPKHQEKQRLLIINGSDGY